MLSLPFFTLRFTPKWWAVVLAMVFMALFVRLGFWQMQRADEKTRMLIAKAEQAKQAPVTWIGDKQLPKQYQQVRLTGHYLPKVFLLDNQHHDHQFGFDVLTPFELSNKKVVLVDRGWVAGDSMRQSFPNVEIPKGVLQLQGAVYFPSTNNWVLGPDFEEKENKITILERINTKFITQILQKSVYPFIIRLDKDQAYGFIREWAVVSMPPQRHLAYALQWFAMALVILIIFVALNLKKIDEKKYN